MIAYVLVRAVVVLPLIGYGLYRASEWLNALAEAFDERLAVIETEHDQ